MFTKKTLVLAIFLVGILGYSQEYKSFEVRYQDNIKGDLTFISNQILNRDGGTATTKPENAYNNLNKNNNYWSAGNRNHETGGYYNFNDYKNMRYIDVDSDPSTFNSSTTTLTFPNVNCNKIRYAGLYWSATYPRDNTSDPVNTPRQHPINKVKLKVPGGSYVTVTADEILYDGLTNNALKNNAPYAAYADITSLLTALENPTGDYTVANIPVAQGKGYDLNTGKSYMYGGSAGGWTLVVVYENPTLSGKLITTFDGFARVANGATTNINYDGFTTIPLGQVNAEIGAATLEGDFKITGDQMRIRASSKPSFTTMSNSKNPANNFFNSNITLDGNLLPGRTPSSSNTLGYDTDIFTLNNFSNSVLPNNETAATFQFRTNRDSYYPFFNSFNIEIIEPNIVLEKKVQNIAGEDISGQGVNLGQTLDYVLSFQNIGNDDGAKYTIKDILPKNVILDESSLVLPPGVTYTYDAATRTVLFQIPDRLIEKGDPFSSIRMRVNVAENCYNFVDACSDQIKNIAYSTYQGKVNDNQITDDPSVTDFDDCGFITPGTTNFLLDDINGCSFNRNVQLCGQNVLLDAGDNFDSYVWVKDENGNNQIDAADTVLNDGDSDNDPSTILVNEVGTYIVDKRIGAPCQGAQEILVVERFGADHSNPIVDWFNAVNSDDNTANDVPGEIVLCSVDGDHLPRIFLCGSNDSQNIQTNITDAESIVWEKLDETSCTAAPDDCANKNASCTWNQVNSGSNYVATTAGKYRVIINYQNGCFTRFYFDVFQNLLDIQYNTRDIICTTNGRINITNLGSNYGFQLVDITNNAILVPFSAQNGPDFTISTNGQYKVDVVQLDDDGNPIEGACIFSTAPIGIRERDFQVDIDTTPSNCNAQGTIKIDILNVEPNYTYILKQADGTLIDDETAQTNNTHTFHVNAGDYIIEVSTADGCTNTQNVSVTNIPDPTIAALLTKNIGCSAGMITVTAANGFPNPDYGFAIWSKNGTNLYPAITDIPGDAYQVENVFNFGWRDTDNDDEDEYFPGEEGTYTFVVVDANGCYAFSNPVTIADNAAMTVTVSDDSPVSCNGSSDAAITIVTSGGVGPFTYSIDGGATTQTTATFVGLDAGTYPIQVTDSSGCTVEQTHEIVESPPLSASAGVSKDASCDTNGAQVRVTNVNGGSTPYQYSFDGGNSYGTSSTAILSPGTYTVIVKDGTGCALPMEVTVEEKPTAPNITLDPNYNCDGTANVTINTDNNTYNYTYEINGVPNSPDSSNNTFTNLASGTYTFRTNYISTTPPTPSLLLKEDFGYGLTVENENTTGYYYENQLDSTTPSGAPIDNGPYINDYEYAVTSSIEMPFSSWYNPVDHTSGDRATKGRYLVINIGEPQVGQVIYKKPINDIIPNQPLKVSLWLTNLIRSGNYTAPNLKIELRHPVSNTLIASASTGVVPENSKWNAYELSLNPGVNTSLNLVIVTQERKERGNDVAIDDISVYQTPEICAQSVENTYTVIDGKAFAANYISSTNVSCNGLSDGTITFEVVNFDATAGFEYSTDGGTTYTSTTTSPVTTPAIYNAGSHTIQIRKADDTSCTTTVTSTISQPATLVANASITTPLNCTNGGATITATATGGIPSYSYQLEDSSGTAIPTYDFATNGTNTVFTGLAPGNYIVRVRDNNSCEDPIDTALTVTPNKLVEFTTTQTECYTGDNDASIVVNVTKGNGNYTFSIDGQPWVTPSPATATTYTFSNLASGTYTINVSDGSNCTGTAQSVTINQELTVSASAPHIATCATSTQITINATGGDGDYVYAVVPTGSTVTDSDFSTTNPVSVSSGGDYDVYVRDNNGFECVQPVPANPDISAQIQAHGFSCSIVDDMDIGATIPADKIRYRRFNKPIEPNSDKTTAAVWCPTKDLPNNNITADETALLNAFHNKPSSHISSVGGIEYTFWLPPGDYNLCGGWDDGYTISYSTTGNQKDMVLVNTERWPGSTTIAPTKFSLQEITLIQIRTSDLNNYWQTTDYIGISAGSNPCRPGAKFSDILAESCDLENDSYCTDVYTVTVVKDAPIMYTVTPTDVSCFESANGAIAINVNSGGQAPFEYSIDNGSTYQINPNFQNLSNGSYTVNVKDANGCEGTAKNVTINQPNAIKAFAAVSKLVDCQTNGNAEVHITNASGGVLPYQYSFDNGLSYGSSAKGYVSQGDHTLIIRDANLCTFEMNVHIDAPLTRPNFDANVTYDCTGEGTVTVSNDNTDYNYTYALDGTANTPNTSNIFTNIPNGTHTVTVNYVDATPPENSLLLSEDFGAGANTSISEIDSGYIYDSTARLYAANVYSVTNLTKHPYFLSPNDHTGQTDGRFLAINLGANVGYSIYEKKNVEVVPNQDVLVSLWAYNLIPGNGTHSNDPNIAIELTDLSGNVIATANTGLISRSKNRDDWKNYTVSLNPGANTHLNIVIRSFSPTTGGNDLALDDLEAYQIPEQCPGTASFDVVVEDGHAFDASITAFKNLDCNNDNTGTITITAENYGPSGYEYSMDGTTYVGPFTTSQQITGLSAQTYSITVRDVANPISGCTVSLSQTLTQPDVIVATASMTDVYTCNNTGATITASVSGGTPGYQYQLEDNSGTIITAYQTAHIFAAVTEGSYIVRVKDSNSCTDPIDTAITVVKPEKPVFNTTATACYSGANDGSIVVNVTSLPGNGGFQFRINSGAWLTPTPATATSYTFDNLANGTYTIDVKDAYGCTGTQKTEIINPQLTAIVNATDITTCNDGSITVTASGGDGAFGYAFVSSGTSVTATDFGTSNTYTITAGNAGNYDVYVWDNNATNPHCTFMETVSIAPATPLTYTVSSTDPACYNGTGSIKVTISSGDNPYTIQLTDLDNAGASNETNTNILATTKTYYNLAPGNYTIKVTDANGCERTQTPITINNPDELTANLNPILPANCNSTDPMDFGFQFTDYPTSYPAGTTIQFSADGGTTWTGDNSNPGTSDQLLGYVSGTSVYPSIRTLIGGVEICRTNLPRYIIPYPLDDLDISISTVVVNCDELQVTVQGTAGVPDYKYTYTDHPSNFDITTATWTAPTPGAHTWIGLIPGRTYVFYVQDSTGCIRQSTVNVNDITTNPLEITSTYKPSCSTADNAEITFTITDTDGIIYDKMRWEFYDINTGTMIRSNAGHPNAVTTSSTITVSNLSPGEYYIVVTEVNTSSTDECVSGSENILIEELNPITASLSKLSDISCNDPGLISVNGIQGGGGTFNFTVTGPAGFTTITNTSDNPIAIPANSPAGDYEVKVTDQYGCYEDVGTISLSLTPNPTIDAMVVNNCASPNSLTITATSTASQILYSIDGGTTYNDNGGVFNNLAVGTYAISIIDSNGCTDTDSIEIHPILEANAALTKLLDCSTTPAAQITLNATSGSGDYDYQVTNSTGTVVTRTSLPSSPYVYNATTADDYVITIFDNKTATPECNRVFTITVPTAITPSFTETHTDVSCNGSTDGTITLTETSNGINPLTYSIAPTAGTFNTATRTFENLPVGTYTITGKGTNDCTDTITNISIGQPAVITLPTPTVQQFACTSGNNENNATITIDNTAITGGSGNYVRYVFVNTVTGTEVQNGSNTTYTETNLSGGSYTITVYDDNGCSGSISTSINAFDKLFPATITVDREITCTNSGENITINANGSLSNSTTAAGLANYEFRQLPSGTFQSSNIFIHLNIGTHNFEVRNKHTGCIVAINHVVEDPNTFEIETTTTNVICFGDDGTASFTISDAVNAYNGGFTWQLYNSQGTADITDDAVITGATGVSTDLGPTAPFDVPAGQYRVEITLNDDPSCTKNDFFTIAGPSTMIEGSTTIDPITCSGNDGSIEIIDVTGGWGTYKYYVGTTAPTAVGDYVTTTKFENLAPGTYQAWVIDKNGCQNKIQNAIVLANPTPIAADLRVKQANCTNYTGEIEVINVSGGQGSNYTYQLLKDNTPLGSAQNTTTFTGLNAGSYTVKITDQWTCTFTTAAQLLYAPIIPLATVVKTIDCTTDPGGQITITQTGGSGSFNYTVTYPDLTTTTTNTTGVFTGLTQVGDYVFTISNQAAEHACPVSITQTLQASITPVTAVDSFTNVSCNTATDGTITVSAQNNGVQPYTFEIISGSGSSATFPISPTSSTSTSAVFTGLEGSIAGITYTIRATGANACTTDITQTITKPALITNVNASVVQFGCTSGNTTNNATITIDDTAITGGSGNYVRYVFYNNDTATTVQDGSNHTYTETNFTGGSYTITVYDDKGCTASTMATINQFVTISDVSVSTIKEVTCSPGTDARIQVGVLINPSTTTTNLEYQVTGINVAYDETNNTGEFTALGVGNYAVSVTNLDTNCVTQTTHQILDPNNIEIIATKLTDEECLNNNVNDGSFSVAIDKYTGSYTYQVYDNTDTAVAGSSGTGNTSTPLIISNLPGGVYYVVITETNAPYCINNSNTVTILSPESPISATITPQASPSCSNDKGSILVEPEGGVGPYTIVVNNTTTSQTYTQTNVGAYIFTGLSGGDYEITVTDTKNCTPSSPYQVTLLTPEPLIADITATALTCFNGNTATVTASINSRNVTPNYLYRLNKYNATGTTIVTTSANQTSNTFENLNAGFYSITVSDDVACVDETPIIEIINPSQVNALLIRTSPLTCETGVELELSASGGSGTYEFSTNNTTWTPMTGSTQNLPITGSLGAGTYRYYVRDAVNGCTAVQSNEITEDAIETLRLSVDKSAAFINCNGDNTASIFATATGGLGNYKFELYTDASLSAASRIAGPQPRGEFANLTAGTYYVNVYSEDCTTPAQQVLITEPTPLEYTDSVTNVSCFGDENGSITVSLSGGSGQYQYAISPNLNKFDFDNTFNNLAPGDYTVIATDRNGCFLKLDYTITAPEMLAVIATATPEICAGDADGTISLNITGGTAPYSTKLMTDANYVEDQVLISGLATGNYIILIRDANGCETDTAVTIEGGANLNATIEAIYECTGDTPNNYINITLEDESVIGDVLYALDSTDLDDMQLNPDFRNTPPGSHYIAIAHSNGCIRTVNFQIENYEPLALTLTQNGLNEITATATGGKEDYTFVFDDINNGDDNTFRINHTDTYLVTVTDANGCQKQESIYVEFIDIEIPNYFTPDGDGLNDTWQPGNQEAFPEILTIVFDRYGREVYRITLDTPGWNGLYHKSELPTGDYWYVIKLNGERDEREFVGHFTLYR